MIRYNTTKPQEIRDGLGQQRTVIFTGKCATCGRKTYGYEDEVAPDPRGMIHEDHCNHPIDPLDDDYPTDLPDVPQCFTCYNTRETNHRGRDLARAKWDAMLAERAA